jgi:hypothetical protein
VDHAVSADAVRPWRTAALVAGAIAALELLLIVAGATVVLAHPLARHAHAPPRAAPAHRAHHTRRVGRHVLLPRARTPLLVLNGNGRQGAAAAEAAHLRARGYPIRSVGNAPRPAYGPTVVMYRPGLLLEARRLARDAGIRLVSPLDGLRVDDLHGARLVVVLGD